MCVLGSGDASARYLSSTFRAYLPAEASSSYRFSDIRFRDFVSQTLPERCCRRCCCCCCRCCCRCLAVIFDNNTFSSDIPQTWAAFERRTEEKAVFSALAKINKTLLAPTHLRAARPPPTTTYNHRRRPFLPTAFSLPSSLPFDLTPVWSLTAKLGHDNCLRALPPQPTLPPPLLLLFENVVTSSPCWLKCSETRCTGGLVNPALFYEVVRIFSSVDS